MGPLGPSFHRIGYLLCLFVFCFLVDVRPVNAQDVFCCSKATGSCRSACEKMSLVEVAADSTLRDASIREINKFCATELTTFWECLNSTLEEISRGQQWSGRSCCSLPQSQQCRLACVTAASRDDLLANCRQSDELLFFNCLDRQDVGDDCCGGARTPECHRACSAIFRATHTPSREARVRVNSACADRSPKVLQCVKNYTRVTPAANPRKQLHCCDKTTNSGCREACRTILKSKTTHQEIIDSLEDSGCGPPLPHDKLWQCFLSSDGVESAATAEQQSSRIDRLGMDSAKLQCCARAATPACRRLCARTFANDWAALWEEFDRNCLAQVAEENLRNCISEVEEPCELGCDGLSYCTNFNNRPTELFRSCNALADEAARFDVALWQQQGNLSILPDLQLAVRNISRCSPATWKAIACTLQIQPCSRHSHVNQICRDDCYDVLSQCVDWSRIAPEHSVASLCSRLSPDSKGAVPCVSLQPYLEPSDYPYRGPEDLVTSPCKGDPCAANELCLVNHNCIGKGCRPYTCSKGCKLGEVSQYLVPEGSYVRIPVTSSGQKGCLKICRCVKGNVEQCQPLPCILLDSCTLGNRKIEHGTSFYMECNECSCFAGEIVCSKRQCQVSALGGVDPAFTTLPCNCLPHYVPVCGRNGNTYPSACLAKCAGLSDTDFEFGPCQDPCRDAKCDQGEICVPDPKVCLSLLHKPCNQYECVNVSSGQCIGLSRQPICDDSNREYPNACFLSKFSATPSYRGPCLSGCRTDGPVCGINGVTYRSECAAWADYTSVDYRGGCVAIGLITDRMSSTGGQCGERVKCAPLADPHCFGYTPPGACCPMCAGALKLIYSRKQIDRALYALKGRAMSSLTLQAILRSLERQIQVAECALRGFLTVELDVFVAVESTARRPSALQLEACVREAEKLASLVRRHSPRIASDLSLSALTAATVVHKSVNGAPAGALLTAGTTAFCCLFIELLFLLSLR